jgi:hypothetical protein
MSISYTAGLDYRRDDRNIASFEAGVEPLTQDLLEIACSVYLADRDTRRPKTWRRKLELEIGVCNDGFWSRREVSGALAGLLAWLTDDDWKVSFARRDSVPQANQMELPTGEAWSVALFSGGLDAALGAAEQLEAGIPLLGLGMQSNNKMLSYQRSAANALRAASPTPFEFRPWRLQRIGPRGAEDATRRSRGLVFLSLGFACARAAGASELFVFENGVGAINLPYTRSQFGSMTSRSVHPRTLELAAHLFSLVAGESFLLRNPCLARTKGEMGRQVPSWATQALALTRSCDTAAAGRSAAAVDCRACGSCILRAVSWNAAGFSGTTRVASDSRSQLPEMLWQVARLQRALTANELTLEFPELMDVPESAMTGPEVVRLFAKYVEEWMIFPHDLVDRFIDRGTRS